MLTYYFDGSSVAVNDPDIVWTDEANVIIDDLSVATILTEGSVSTNEITVGGTNAPTSSSLNVVSVLARVYGKAAYYTISDVIYNINAAIYTSGGQPTGTLLGTAIRTYTSAQLPQSGWGVYVPLLDPPGGWDWNKLSTLEMAIYISSGPSAPNTAGEVALVQLLVTTSGGLVSVDKNFEVGNGMSRSERAR